MSRINSVSVKKAVTIPEEIPSEWFTFITGTRRGESVTIIPGEIPSEIPEEIPSDWFTFITGKSKTGRVK